VAARIRYLIGEELGWGDSGLSIALGVCGFPAMFANLAGKPELIKRFASPNKREIGCWAVTEPDHGSDSLAFDQPVFDDPDIRPNCIATKEGDEYVIRGQKAAWVSNGSIATVATSFCTAFSLLGGMATAIYSEPRLENDADNPVRRVMSAGMPAAIWESFAERFQVEKLEWYGAVEGGMAFNPVGVGPMGSFGKPPPGLEMKILDGNDVECAPGIQGEICSRALDGTSASVEYHENPEASEKKTRGGWLRSGDIGHTDDEGWFFFDYRKGGSIRQNGDFVNISFVEKAIAEVPSITDVFIYGVEAAFGAPGEKDVVAAIVPTDASSLSIDEVFVACRESLESNFVPSYLQVVDEIPKTASEKPRERLLLADFAVDAANVYTETR